MLSNKTVAWRTLAMAPLAAGFALPCAAATPTAYLESAGIVGQGGALKIFRLPVANSTGKITYYDVGINLTVNNSGVPAVSTTPTVVKSATLQTNNFQPGRYFVKYGNVATQFGTLTSGVGTGGATVWTLVMAQNPNGDFPNQATWQTGTPAPDVQARLTAAKVVANPNFSYGLTVNGGGTGGFHRSNGIMAAQQVNSTLTLSSYTAYGGSDSALTTGSVVFTLCADTACSNAPK